MLNGYNKRFTGSDRRSYVLIHPSSRHLSRITKHTAVIMWYLLGILLGNFIAAVASGTGPLLAIVILPIVIMLMIRSFTSYRILGDTYNSYLLPIEQAYGRMSKEDKRRYKKYLENAYRNCSRDVEFDRQANRNVLELFNLTAGEQGTEEKSDLELELEAVRAKIEQKKETKRLLDEALIAEKQILEEIESKVNGH